MSHARSEYEDFKRIAPDAYDLVLALGQLAAKAGLDRQLLELVKLRVSQVNGCAFCVQHHVLLSERIGLPADKLHLVAVWREAPIFSPRERAALAWAESLTGLSHGAPADALYEALQAHFDERGIAEVTMAVALINAWNRLSVGLQAEVP